ncbi:MAG: FkbM family methyltransferase [Paracoccaceae bacterium]
MARPRLERLRFLHGALNPDRPTRIVDIGANPISPAPYNFLLNKGLAHVYGFEPQPEAYAKLLNDPHPNRTVLPYAVGDGTRATLHVCEASGFTSLLEPNPEFHGYTGKYAAGMRVVDRFKVDTKRLDDIEDLDEFDLLKIDIQGGEAAVFEHGSRKISQALMVYTEIAAIPLYKNQPLLDQQMSLLRGHGYHLLKFMFFKQVHLRRKAVMGLAKRISPSQLIDGDAVFIRNLLSLNTLTSEQLKHLAILAESVIQSHDLSLVAVEELVTRRDVPDDTLEGYRDVIRRTMPLTED